MYKQGTERRALL